MNNKLGFMQGRLSDIVDGKIQSFPWINWKNEFEKANNLGFKLMEWTIDYEDFYKNPLMNLSGQKKIKDLSKKYSLRVNSLTADCFMQNPFWKTTGSIKEKLENDFIHLLDCASILGINLIVLPLVDNGSVKNKYQKDYLISFFSNISAYLKKQNTKIAFESDYTPQELMKFIMKFDTSIIGVNYDTGNSASLGYEPKQEIEIYGNHIFNVHIKDRFLGGQTTDLGDGNANFKIIFEELDKKNYKGNYILQVARDKNNDHENMLIKSVNFLNKYIN